MRVDHTALKVMMRPLRRPVKKVSGIWVRVCLLVLNLEPPTLRLMISELPWLWLAVI